MDYVKQGGSGGERLLVNYWYAHPLGHTIEALRYCLGYHRAAPELSVNVLLNAASPSELADYCSFVDHTYAVPYRTFAQPDGDPTLALRNVPKTWDWIVDNHRTLDPGHDAFRGFRAFFDAADEHFVATRGRGIAGGEPPAYEANHRLTLELPSDARVAAHDRLTGRHAISVVLAGSSAERALYPSATSWELVLGALAERFSDAIFCLIGKSNQNTTLSTSRISVKEVERIAQAVPSIDCFDLPLAHQLAIVEASSLLVSPHTGFSFGALAVGTPWLAISGGRWHEYFFNGVPFHSVLPDPDRYSPFAWNDQLPLVEDIDGEGLRTPSMGLRRLREDLPEIVDEAESLINGETTYEEALIDYFPRLLRAYHGDTARVFSFDNIHQNYL